MRFHPAGKVVAAVLLLASTILPLSAHEGHDHGAAAPAAAPALPRAEGASEAFEMVIVAKGGELTIYLDRFATNEPVRDAAITLETPQGSVEAKRTPDGSYQVPSPWAEKPGSYDLIATVTHDGIADILALTLDIPSPANSPGVTESNAPRQLVDRLSSGNTSALMWPLATFLIGGVAGFAAARRRKAVLTIMIIGATLALSSHIARAHEGEDHDTPPPATSAARRDVAQMLPDGNVFVPKSTQRILAIRTLKTQLASYRRTIELPGRIIADPNASGYVQAAVSGRLSPPEGGFPRLGTRVRKGDVLAYVTPPLQAIDISDMRQRQGELDQQISIVERRLARYETLAPSGAVARSQLEDTRLELQGLKDRRLSLDKVRREPEALIAPVDGIIAEGTPVAGQIAQNNAVVFQITDPSRLWVEALSYEALPPLQHANAQASGKELSLVFRGAGFADRNQSIPLHFAIEGAVPGLRIGQFVTVFAETPDEQRGLAIPRTGIVRTASGQDAVYEHIGAERFALRPVRIEPLDGQRVLIMDGLTSDTRVVVQGAELIDHIR